MEKKITSKHAGVASILQQTKPYVGAPIEDLIKQFAQSSCYEATNDGKLCYRTKVYTKGDQKLNCEEFCHYANKRTRDWLRPLFRQVPFSVDLEIRHKHGPETVTLPINEVSVNFLDHHDLPFLSFIKLGDNEWQMWNQERLPAHEAKKLHRVSSITALVFSHLVVYSKRDKIKGLEVQVNLERKDRECNPIECKVERIIGFNDALGNKNVPWFGDPKKWITFPNSLTRVTAEYYYKL